jgi:hypothetical protein
VKRQRWLAFVIVGIAALVAVAAFYLARACGCDERQVGVVTLTAGALAIMALVVAR